MTLARSLGAVSGVIGTGVALGAGELAAGATRPQASPVVAVADAALDLSPRGVKEFAIQTFGTHDKPVLVAGIVVVLGLLAAAVGVLAVDRPWVGLGFTGGMGAVGLAAALTRPDVHPLDGLPSLLAALAGAATLYALLWRQPAPPPAPARGRGGTPPAGTGGDRRAFLRTGGVALGAAAAAGVTGRALETTRFSVASARAKVRLPAGTRSVPALPASQQLTAPGLSPYYTPNGKFYRVDTAIVVPEVEPTTWRLNIHGMVDRPLSLTYDQLTNRNLIERDVTLTCVSNEVGDPYVGNARWTGAHLAELLEQVGVHEGADQLVCRSADGMTIGAPIAAITDGRDSMLAVGMNGTPLPVEHGFPVRMVVPGLYGYVSACKWIVDIEATTFSRFDAYWVDQGWAQQAPIRTESRIDTPKSGSRPVAGRVAVAGVAWAQHRGIDKVEVQVDDGPWQECRLGGVSSLDTWRQWLYEWDATPGSHHLRVRATDGKGRTQTQKRASAYPSGATGWHTVSVTVRDG